MTVEVRTWLDRTSGYTVKHEVLWWKTETPAQVRDRLYPGVDMNKDVQAMLSLTPSLGEFCNGYQLADNKLAQLPPGHEVYLIELA